MEEKANILIVDDDVGLGKTMSLVLHRKGYAVESVPDGPSAITRVEQQAFDMVFMDIKMPVMNGVEAYKRIRPDATVVMMTAYALEDLVQEALKEGAYGIVYKPLDVERVVGLIEEARQGGRGALILVVDDDPGTCTLLRNVLDCCGWWMRSGPGSGRRKRDERERAYSDR